MQVDPGEGRAEPRDPGRHCTHVVEEQRRIARLGDPRRGVAPRNPQR